MSTAQTTSPTAAERAQQALASSPVHALRGLHVESVGDQLLLQGRVCSFYHKQLAQEAVLAVAREAILNNTIDVEPAPARYPR